MTLAEDLTLPTPSPPVTGGDLDTEGVAVDVRECGGDLVEVGDEEGEPSPVEGVAREEGVLVPVGGAGEGVGNADASSPL